MRKQLDNYENFTIEHNSSFSVRIENYLITVKPDDTIAALHEMADKHNGSCGDYLSEKFANRIYMNPINIPVFTFENAIVTISKINTNTHNADIIETHIISSVSDYLKICQTITDKTN